ncbi:MAG: Ig-like domain repeat protein [Algoriphagus sp.]|nr:Ig-like domain repeat protein [Algoriphagus sp.]
MKMKCIYIVLKYTKRTMKTFKSNLLGLALAGLILGACSQTGMYETADLMNEQASAKAGFNLSPFGMNGENARTYTDDAHSTSCITTDQSTWFVRSYEHVFDITAPAKKVKVDVYNTPTHLIYKFNTENTTVQFIQIDGVFVVNDQAVSTYTHSVPLNSSWAAGNTITAAINVFRNNTSGGGGGNRAQFATSYNLVGICTTTTLSAGTTEPICVGADAFTLTATVTTSAETLTGGFIQILNSSNEVVASEAVTSTVRSVTYNVPTENAGNYTYSAQYVRSTPSFRYQGSVSSTTSTVQVIECGGCDIKGNEFSGEAVSCGTAREANFVFGSEDGVSYFKIQGGLTNFTGADAVVTVTGGTTTTEQRTPGGSSNRVITVEGSVGACETVIVNVKWNSANSGGIITGEWSVKDANGVELAPEVAGLSCPN